MEEQLATIRLMEGNVEEDFEDTILDEEIILQCQDDDKDAGLVGTIEDFYADSVE